MSAATPPAHCQFIANHCVMLVPMALCRWFNLAGVYSSLLCPSCGTCYGFERGSFLSLNQIGRRVGTEGRQVQDAGD
jgi:hypothetical protein